MQIVVRCDMVGHDQPDNEVDWTNRDFGNSRRRRNEEVERYNDRLNDHDKYSQRKWNEMNLMITTEIPFSLKKHAC